ncbi:MAG: hypothetical protein OXN27_02040 [Candidatus Poribacteria bacterium]|nr:hypothetical protein [Candidatus Poribacteria bacterium]MDE0322677.1 hypothetical protein [Candidatus Poribacteria bacterium]
MKNIVVALIIIGSLLIANNNYGAVTSVGEINVVGQTRGVVPASSTVPLIVTLVIDRSLAEPGEEIKTIEIAMPSGFLTQSSYFKGILRDRNEIPARPVVSGGNVLRVELADAIVDFQNSIYEITFECQTPGTIILEAVFRARLRNRDDAPIGEFIRPGQADGKLNNDDFTLQVIPNVPPDLVIGFTAEADETGENDVTLRWQKSEDPDVNGYLIYRNNENSVTEDDTINVENRSSTTFRDVNVPPGSYTYQIVAYKTIFLQSERSPKQTVVVSPDTAAPEPPTMLSLTPSSDGIEILWKPSISRDVTTYRITEGLTTLTEIEINELKTEYKFIDNRPLPTGSFTYAIIAIDEAGNESIPLEKRLRILDEPYPNPFTPLSPDEDFNQVVFPARALEEASGEFTVLIFDIDGMLVRHLTASPGETELIWDGRNEAGEIVESGVYVYQLQVGESFKTGTLIAAK